MMINNGLRLNSVPASTFELKQEADPNALNGMTRNEHISVGRWLALEYAGGKKNEACRSAGRSEEFASKITRAGGYSVAAQKHKEALLLYCAACQYRVEGRAPTEDVKDVYNDMTLLSQGSIFLKTLAGITTEVITPLLPYVISDVAGYAMNWTTVPIGKTREVIVHSNDIFMFEDSSWGSNRAKPLNRLYDKTVTLNPTLKTANAKINWFQMVSNDVDIGWYYNSIIAGMYSKIMGEFTQALVAAAQSSRYVPQYLRYASYNTANWANATTRCATANGLPREQLFAFGDYRALQAVLPLGTASDTALTYGLGEEWVRNGFLSLVGRIPLFEVQNTLVPGTANMDMIQEVFPTDTIFIAGRGTTTYAPMYGAFGDGSPITVEMSMSQTGKFEVDILISAFWDIKPVFASKVAVITGVSLT